jgi:hypothetical protein
MRFARIYFVKGALRDKRSRSLGWNYYVTDPPVAGTTSAFIFDEGNKVLIFHPYTLTAFVVPPDASEVVGVKDVLDWNTDKNKSRLVDMILEKWKLYKHLDMQRSYDVAAKVLLELGGSAPKESELVMPNRPAKPIKPQRVSGKPAEGDRFKPLKSSGRRAEVAAHFTGGGSILEGMATFNLTRSAILSHLFCIWRDHGIGYSIQGDSAKLEWPTDEPVLEEDDPLS